MDYEARAKRIALLILDVDGVLTNAQLVFDSQGEVMKVFHTQDGLGITAAHKAGLKTAIITGRETEMVRRRGLELKIGDVYQGAMDKVQAFQELLAKYQLSPEQVAYVGDDLNDLAVLTQVGLACAVANAVPDVKERVHFITTREGGRGAVREVIELILKSQGKWEAIVEAYMRPGKQEVQQ
jgi:3-deoxy-D-manno-octulosonate 8-phosphate phosphatase (KDO 8-P phosphatase)